MSEPNYVIGEINFGPARSEVCLDDAGVCTSCGYEVTPVRPGKAQCDFCDTVDKWKSLADQLAAALGHSWFAAKVDQRGKLMDFLEKKKAALAAYEEATK